MHKSYDGQNQPAYLHALPEPGGDIAAFIAERLTSLIVSTEAAGLHDLAYPMKLARAEATRVAQDSFSDTPEHLAAKSGP